MTTDSAARLALTAGLACGCAGRPTAAPAAAPEEVARRQLAGRYIYDHNKGEPDVLDVRADGSLTHARTNGVSEGTWRREGVDRIAARGYGYAWERHYRLWTNGPKGNGPPEFEWLGNTSDD